MSDIDRNNSEEFISTYPVSIYRLLFKKVVNFFSHFNVSDIRSKMTYTY
jgi:hypothetical protein